MNTVVYVERALSKHKPAKVLASIQEREKATAIIFKLLQQEQFDEEMKSLKAKTEFSEGSKILQFSSFLDEEELIRVKGRIGKKLIGLQCKAANFATFETSFG